MLVGADPCSPWSSRAPLVQPCFLGASVSVQLQPALLVVVALPLVQPLLPLPSSVLLWRLSLDSAPACSPLGRGSSSCSTPVYQFRINVMDSKDNPGGVRRKVKFQPKAPPRRVPKPEVKSEPVEDDGAVQARDLLRRFNESAMKAKHKVEKKVSASQIAFGIGGESTSIKSYGLPRGESNINSGQGSAFGGVREKEYKEPWDYYSYYPVTLPLRRPYSGNPEFLDEEEFGEAAESRTYDENSSNPAMELGLLEENPEASMFLIHLPPTLPMTKQSATAGGQDVKENSKPPSGAKNVKPCKLNELPSGFMGKMLVYRSGAIKLKLGDTIYDVSSGMNCAFTQDVVAMNNAQKYCCEIGEIGKHATITPDIDATIDSMAAKENCLLKEKKTE